MRASLGTIALLALLAGTTLRAQAVAPEPETITTFTKLTNSANAVIVGPSKPDAQRSRIAVLLMHPDHVNTFNYFIGAQLSKRGYRVMMMNYYGPEQVYEEFLPPLAAAIKHLKGLPGVQKVVLAGHSTGGAVLTYYQDVAENGLKACQGAQRVYPCSGKNLDGLPPADGVMILDSSAGAFERLIALDPSVDSRRPRVHEPHLDLFNSANGFDPKTRSGTYSAQFVGRYLAAQAARQTALIRQASERLGKIEKGAGDYRDDEPFVIPGSSVHAYDGARLDLADLRFLSKTHAPHPLLKADGSMPTQILESTRPPLAVPDNVDQLNQTTLNVTVRHFLSFLAMRVGPDYRVTEGTVSGVDWRSVPNSIPGNIQGIRVPSLFMSATCAPHLVFTEIAYDLAPARDKEFLGVDGANHQFEPCKPEYGDTAKHAFDYVDSWLMKAGRF